MLHAELELLKKYIYSSMIEDLNPILIGTFHHEPEIEGSVETLDWKVYTELGDIHFFLSREYKGDLRGLLSFTDGFYFEGLTFEKVLNYFRNGGNQ